ncbi:hypothetical protein C7Y72_19095 [Paraconexibacter algicola]|uniref:Uncharacterized protein n=1 Tax=Paraconexibacter algicola TaxID=2133960 RepID=A0A2T4UE05_9ACTN|nr:hypothetical protein C7Y72_19095 [Paraconexibacter algicola]
MYPTIREWLRGGTVATEPLIVELLHAINHADAGGSFRASQGKPFCGECHVWRSQQHRSAPSTEDGGVA